MINFVQKIIYWFLSFQEKALTKSLKRNMKTSYTHSTSKKVFSGGNSLEITSLTEKNKERLLDEVQKILKKAQNQPEVLLKFIEKNGTKVIKIKFADKILKIINCDEGFIASKRGLKALCLSIFISVFTGKVKPALKTEAMFVLKDMQADPYTMIQQFHKWYAMKLDLPGFDSESQENFQKFLYSDEGINALSVDEILGLKEAIARDKEAIDFVVNLAKSTTGSKKAMKKLTDGGASI